MCLSTLHDAGGRGKQQLRASKFQKPIYCIAAFTTRNIHLTLLRLPPQSSSALPLLASERIDPDRRGLAYEGYQAPNRRNSPTDAKPSSSLTLILHREAGEDLLDVAR